MNRGRLARSLAPLAPPCFDTRSQWLEYVASAAVEQRPGRMESEPVPGPLKFEEGKPVSFDPAFAFCADCTHEYMTRMSAEGRCQPLHIVMLLGTTIAEAA